MSKETYSRPYHLLFLSGNKEKAVSDIAHKYIDHLAIHTDQRIEDICYTSATEHSHLQFRSAVLCKDREDLSATLPLLIEGKRSVNYISGETVTSNKLLFLYTGQGSQYLSMGKQLYETSPIFRKSLKSCAAEIDRYIDRPLLSVLFGKDDRILNNTRFTQPAIYAIQFALGKLWLSWGIKPDAVVGHSVGEFAAACMAGIFSMEEGARLISERARLMSSLPAGGGMAALMIPRETAEQYIEPYTDDISIAACNGPDNTVVSGKSQVLSKLYKRLDKEKILYRELKVSHAFHSALMDPILEEFREVAGDIQLVAPHIPIISDVSGDLGGDEMLESKYWSEHIRKPVQFYDSMKTTKKIGCTVYLEIGPNPVLLGMGRKCIKVEESEWLPSMRHNKGDWEQMLSSLGKLYVRGNSPDWEGLFTHYPTNKKP